ncbi:hypothetical protein APHAL10511_000597 [Amanita phalloides]|nr:hypothetical protein APHAL10511_000597 [Amanita phalloides]
MVSSSWAPAADFIAGTLSGIAGLVVGYPFDTVKVRFQNPILASRYTSNFHAFVSIIREEGFMGLFKGITSPLATTALSNGFFFASYHFFLKIVANVHAIPTLTQVFIAGACTGIAWSVVTTPAELIKIRQQDQLVPTSTWNILIEIIREDGILGLYRGLAATILRDTSYGPYFATYEGTSRLISQTNVPWYAPLLAGGVAGIVGWIATFPFDVVKTRMQRTEQRCVTLNPHELGLASTMTGSTHTTLLNNDTITDIKANPYESVVSTIIHSYREEGFGVFFQGLGITIIRAIPVNMAIFTTFEVVSHIINFIH